VSWIGAEDFYTLLFRAVVDPAMEGLYHLAAPDPVQNREFMAAYRAAVGRRFGLPSTAFITKIGAQLLGSDPALALTGRRCVPTRLLDEGFEFTQTDISATVAAAINAPTSPN
jgi:NAD dependent epimerase/dehydratase family enzyme